MIRESDAPLEEALALLVDHAEIAAERLDLPADRWRYYARNPSGMPLGRRICLAVALRVHHLDLANRFMAACAADMKRVTSAITACNEQLVADATAARWTAYGAMTRFLVQQASHCVDNVGATEGASFRAALARLAAVIDVGSEFACGTDEASRRLYDSPALLVTRVATMRNCSTRDVLAQLTPPAVWWEGRCGECSRCAPARTPGLRPMEIAS